MFSIFRRGAKTTFGGEGRMTQKKGWLSKETTAVLATLLTLGNGLISLVSGLQWLLVGGSLVPHEDTFETGVGALMDILSAVYLVILFTRLKVGSLLVGLTCRL